MAAMIGHCTAAKRDEVISGKIRGVKRVALYSNSISKVKQGDDERTTKAVQSARRGVRKEGNAVSPKKWDWNYL